MVGDAAGLVDPLSGDGIYEAFVSARLAADAILVGRPEGYERDSRPPSIGTQAFPGRPNARPTAFRRACLWAVRAPGVFDAVAGYLRGDLAHPSEARRLARPPMRVLSRLARSAPPVP